MDDATDFRTLAGGVRARPLAVEGAWEFVPPVHADDRGIFVAPYQELAFVDAVGHPFPVAQTNQNRSAAGVLRGVHYVADPPGQHKLVGCVRGRALDLVVDLRVGSPTFGAWDQVHMDDQGFHCLYFPVGTGHAFIALTDDTVLSYLVSTVYDPALERTIHPLDPTLDLPWPTDLAPILSDRDRNAPTVRSAAEQGLLPRYRSAPAGDAASMSRENLRIGDDEVALPGVDRSVAT